VKYFDFTTSISFEKKEKRREGGRERERERTRKQVETCFDIPFN
jgi:hypothetical protein